MESTPPPIAGTNDQDMKMRLCLIGGVIILLVIIIGTTYNSGILIDLVPIVVKKT